MNISLQYFICILEKKMAYYFQHGLEILPKQPGQYIQLPELLHMQNKLQKGPECKVSQERKNLLQASL